MLTLEGIVAGLSWDKARVKPCADSAIHIQSGCSSASSGRYSGVTAFLSVPEASHTLYILQATAHNIRCEPMSVISDVAHYTVRIFGPVRSLLVAWTAFQPLVPNLSHRIRSIPFWWRQASLRPTLSNPSPPGNCCTQHMGRALRRGLARAVLWKDVGHTAEWRSRQTMLATCSACAIHGVSIWSLERGCMTVHGVATKCMAPTAWLR